ncbi:hypothetical protein ACLOJK_026667 [Asimina triloba]
MESAATPPPALQPPLEITIRIFSQLDCIDLIHCSLVCKQWYRETAEMREDWKKELDLFKARSLFGFAD